MNEVRDACAHGVRTRSGKLYSSYKPTSPVTLTVSGSPSSPAGAVLMPAAAMTLAASRTRLGSASCSDSSLCVAYASAGAELALVGGAGEREQLDATTTKTAASMWVCITIGPSTSIVAVGSRPSNTQRVASAIERYLSPIPSTGSDAAAWKTFTAALVFGPSRPSILAGA